MLLAYSLVSGFAALGAASIAQRITGAPDLIQPWSILAAALAVLMMGVFADPLLATVRRVRVERAAGAPWAMIRVYAGMEWKHTLAGHPGEMGYCNPCHGIPPGATVDTRPSGTR